MTATYRALFCDLRTDKVLDAFPLSQVSMDDYIGKTGTLTATLYATDADTAARIKAAITPGRTAVWVERDRAVWWAGIVWTLTTTSASRDTPAKADIQAATLDSYLDHRELNRDLSAKDADQFDIARGLVNWAQSDGGGNIGIRLGPRTLSGVKRTRTYSRYDLPKISDLLDQLATVEDGFEWRIRCYRDDTGRRVKELQLGHPHITTARGPRETVLDYPGPVTAATFGFDATTRATHWHSRGATSTATNRPLMSTFYVIRGAIEEGWPRLDGSSDYTTITTKPALDEHARADLLEAYTREVVPDITVNLEAAQLTPAILGAIVRLRIADVWTPTGSTHRYRVVGFAVRGPERDQPETASLTLDAATRGDLDGHDDEGSRTAWL